MAEFVNENIESESDFLKLINLDKIEIKFNLIYTSNFVFYLYDNCIMFFYTKKHTTLTYNKNFIKEKYYNVFVNLMRKYFTFHVNGPFYKKDLERIKKYIN